jgi:ubiquinone/menaquinone biosynthesis C-methylase UbiE
MKTQGRSEETYAKLYDYLYGFSFYVKFIRLVYFWELSRIVHYVKLQRAVDVGCGTGDSTKLLLRLDIPRIYAVDPNPHMLRIARLKLQDPRVSFLEGTMETLDRLLDPGSVDLIAAIFGPMARTEDPEKALAAAAKVLRTGGILAFDVFNRWSGTFVKRFGKHRVPWITFRKKLKGQRVKSKIRLYDPKEIEILLEQEGFKILKKISLFNYVLPRYSVVTRYPLDIFKCFVDFSIGRLLRKSSGNIIIYITQKI